jgi:hypothetical protein
VTRRLSRQASRQGSQQTLQAHSPTVAEPCASPLSAAPTLPTLETAVQVLTQDPTQQDNNSKTDTDEEEHQPQEPSPTIKGESVSVLIPSAAKGKVPASPQPNQKPAVPVIQTAGTTSSSHATNITTAAPPPPPPTQVHTQITRPALLRNMSSLQGAAANAPKPFSGDRSKAKAFICQCLLYFQACPQDFWIDSNTKTVNEQKKIAWTLLFLDDGYAAGWRDEYVYLWRSKGRQGTEHTTYNHKACGANSQQHNNKTVQQRAAPRQDLLQLFLHLGWEGGGMTIFALRSASSLMARSCKALVLGAARVLC